MWLRKSFHSFRFGASLNHSAVVDVFALPTRRMAMQMLFLIFPPDCWLCGSMNAVRIFTLFNPSPPDVAHVPCPPGGHTSPDFAVFRSLCGLEQLRQVLYRLRSTQRSRSSIAIRYVGISFSLVDVLDRGHPMYSRSHDGEVGQRSSLVRDAVEFVEHGNCTFHDQCTARTSVHR
jgi:hypothetical protein